jgi:hypothetical protein
MSSNPITSVAPSSSPITSVSQAGPPRPLGHHTHNPNQVTRLNLDLRGQLFPVDRETLMLLPESVLLGLFPQGLVLSKPATWEGGNDGVFAVDVSSLLCASTLVRSGLMLAVPPRLLLVHLDVLVPSPGPVLRHAHHARPLPRAEEYC